MILKIKLQTLIKIYLFIYPILLFPLEEWMYIYHPTLKDPYILKQIEKYDILSFTGYKIDAQGNILKFINIENIEYKLKNKKVYPLISLRSTKEGKILLRNLSNRKNAINNILNLIQKDIFKGVHIDFEYLTKEDAPNFKDFLKELQISLHQLNKTLTVAIFPPIWEMPYNEFHDLSLLHPYIDEIVLMTYDQHNPRTKPGPIAEYNWVEKNIKETLKYFKSSQVFLGIPLYGYEWELKTNHYKIVDNSYFLKILKRNNFIQKESSVLYGTKIQYRDKNGLKILYYPDPNFRELLKQLALTYQLKGIAYWRAGFEK